MRSAALDPAGRVISLCARLARRETLTDSLNSYDCFTLWDIISWVDKLFRHTVY